MNECESNISIESFDKELETIIINQKDNILVNIQQQQLKSQTINNESQNNSELHQSKHPHQLKNNNYHNNINETMQSSINANFIKQLETELENLKIKNNNLANEIIDLKQNNID